MIFREIKITNQKPVKAEIPESWDDVTFKQLNALMNDDDTLSRLSILTNIPKHYFSKYPELADFYVWVESKLEWANKWDEDNSDVETFMLKDGVFNFPKDIGMLSVGLYKDIQSEVQENKDDILSTYPLICASYYQIIKDGEYDYIKAKEYISMFDDQPCKAVWNAAGFFLSKVESLKNGTKRGVRGRVIQVIKRWLALIGFRKYSGLKLYPHS